MASKYIVVRQDTLEGRQADGTWGELSTAQEYAKKARAQDAARKAKGEIARLVTVQRSIRPALTR